MIVNAGGPLGTPDDERRRRVDAEADRLVGLGATVVREQINEAFGNRCMVMRDPEGSEFCLQ